MEKMNLTAFLNRVGGKMLAVASDATLDRQGESLPAESWDLANFQKNPVLMFAHDYSKPPVGVAANVRLENGKLVFEPQFHAITPMAEQVAAMYDAGVMSAFSVGFQPKETQRGTTLELLEISCVPVPANPNALVVEREVAAAITKSLEAIPQEVTQEQAAKVKAYVAQWCAPELKGVIPYADHGIADEGEAWDGPAEIAAAGDDIEKLKAMCAWFDSENADLKSAYKLPHHEADDLKAVWAGVVAAMAALAGARGGVDIPDADVPGVYGHLAKHYAAFGQEPPKLEDVMKGEAEPTKAAPTGLAAVKEGRVLSAKNRELVTNARDALNDLLNAAEPQTQGRAAPSQAKVEPTVPRRASVEVLGASVAKHLAEKISAQIAYQLRNARQK